eukprot:4248128-Prymnesium_polylepis.1
MLYVLLGQGSNTYQPSGQPVRLAEPRAVWCAGRRRGASAESRLDHNSVRQYLDPRDRGEGTEPKEEKLARA